MAKKWILLLVALLLAGLASAEGEITSLAQLEKPGATIGVSQGSAAEKVVQAQLPEAQLMYFTDNPSAYLALAQGKIEAFVYDYSQMQIALKNGVEGVHLLDETLGEPIRVAVGVSPASGIPELKDEVNKFIAQLRQDGTLDDMRRRWVIEGDQTMPDIPLPENADIHLTVGTTGIVPPYSYYAGTELWGFDIELAHRFAAWLGADLRFKVYDYGAIIPACVTGDVDCVMANLNITPERAEALPFSDVLYEERLGILVRGEAAEAQPDAAGGMTLNDLNGRRVGVQSGSSFDAMIAEQLPDAQLEYYMTKADLVAALTGHKIDAFVVDEPVAQILMREYGELTYLPEFLDSFDCGFVFAMNDAGTALRDQFNAFLAPLKADGTLDALAAKWFGDDEGAKTMPDIAALSAENGTLHMATESGYAPFEYVRDGQVVGYDMELACMFCQACGYGLDIVDMNFDGILPSVQTGKCDFAAAGIGITPERAESVLFSDANFSGGTVLVVLKADGAKETVQQTNEVRWQDYNGKRLGVLVGPLMEDAAKTYFPDSEVLVFNGYPDCTAALIAGKIDAYLADGPSMKTVHAEQPQINYIHDYITRNDYSFAFRKNDPGSAALCEALNDFLARSWADGTMQEIDDIWFGVDEDRKVVDMSGLTGENGTIRVITTSTDMPFSYIKDGRNVGYDIDLVVRFCRDQGYALELFDVDFAGRIPALEAGKGDFTTDMNVTPEREEQVLFSDPTSYGGIVLAVLSEDLAASGGQRQAARPDALNGKRAGVITGSFHDAVIAEELPEATISQYNSYTDMIAALKADKIDFFLASAEVSAHLTESDDAVTALDAPIRIQDIGAMFAKTEQGDALRAQMDAFITRIRRDGTLDEIYRFWSDPANESASVDMSGLTGENGTLRFATSGTKVPVSFVANGQIAGTDPDIAVRFCREYGYGIEVSVVDTAGIIPGIVTGMYDFSLSDMVITDERKESVSFSVPYHAAELLVLTRSGDMPAAETTVTEEKAGFMEQLQSSFNKTFIREDRWKLFKDGVVTTLLITLLTILFGTLLGFALFMLCRNGSIIANGATRFSMWLVQGMPMVVLLMILYYIIFGSVAISGVAVAVIGFTLTFGAAVYGLLKMGVGAVDNGQYEAAYALGYSNRRTFYKIILPQALPHVLPAYRGEIVGLIKATAIVGYIAVQDLTKMGDIVRSRTYEAFFPLIAVAVIYFVLEGLVGIIVSRIGVNFNPKRRKRADILKGVKTDD